MRTILIIAGVFLAIYLLFVGGLYISGRKQQARAWAGFIPDCIVLFKRLISDARVSRFNKVLLGAMILYLALPIDIVPDFIPIAGQLDDAILVAFVLRRILKQAGSTLITEHWPGPETSLIQLLRLVGDSPIKQ